MSAAPPPGGAGAGEPATHWPDRYAAANRASSVTVLNPTGASPSKTAATGTTPTAAATATATAAAAAAPSTADEDNSILTIAEARFYAFSWAREVLFWTLCLLTGFLLRLLLRWNDDWHARLRYDHVPSTDPAATHVVCMALDKYHTLVPIRELDSATGQWVAAASSSPSSSSSSSVKAFEWRSTLFWWDPRTLSWTRVVFDVGVPYHELHRRAAVTAWEASVSPANEHREERTNMYGANILDVKPKPFLVLILEEALRPFFAFQVFSMIVWFFQNYVVYAYTVLALSLLAILNTAFTTWTNINDLQRLAKSDVPVQRLVCSNVPEGDPRTDPAKNPGWSPIPTLRPVQAMSSTLLPGDLIQISADLVLPCDVVLLTGSCVVNEAMLTGESAPVLKAPLPATTTDVVFNPAGERDTKYMLFSGTRVVQARASAQAPLPVTPIDPSRPQPTVLWQMSKDVAAAARSRHLGLTDAAAATRAEKQYREHWRGSTLPVVGMVVQTGFSTAKGQLIRAILYPKPSKFDFQRQSYNFIVILLLACFAGCLATIGYSVQLGEDALDVFKQCLNLITVTIPPALPLALSIGLSAALLRIQNMGIFCTSPPRITAAGRVNCLCFDKTGTLTEEGLTLEGIHSVQARADGSLVVSPLEKQLSFFYHSTMSERKTSTVYTARQPSDLSPDDLAASLRLGMVHVLAACHGLSVLQSGSSHADPQHKTVAVTKREEGEDEALTPSQQPPYQTLPLDEQAKTHFVGDPLEVQMFINTGWSFMARTDASENDHASDGFVTLPPSDEILATKIWSLASLPRHVDTILFPPASYVNPDSQALAVLRRFDFDSSLRRMSVIVQHMPVELLRHPETTSQTSPVRCAILTKGAPESIKDICLPSTIPVDFDATLRKLTIEGFRVLACAVRPWTAEQGGDSAALHEVLMTGPRANLEQNLLFTGFLVMENKLKKETSPMLETYIRAGLRCIMVTGDNPLTAIAVGKRCGPFFVRPSRRICMLDLEGKKLVLRDVVRPEVHVDFNDYVSGRIAGFRVNTNPYFSTGQGSSHAEWARLSQDIDFAVTGPAFTALQSQHDDIMAQRLEQIANEAATHSRRWWRPLDTLNQGGHAYESIDEAGQVTGPIVRTETGHRIPLTPLQVVLSRANIFARMSPQNKQQLMTSLQDLSYVVCMTGDGANDSGALKAADIGISIQASEQPDVAASKEKAHHPFGWLEELLGIKFSNVHKDKQNDSVAAAPSIAAPFSTQIAHIGAVHMVLTEGRCCLVSTFAMFKYMFCYGVIQFTSVIVLYKMVLELADYQYLWADLGLVFPLVLTMPLITAQKQLCRGRPESDLLAPSVFRSVFFLSALIVGFQVFASEMLHWQSFYKPPVDCEDCSDATDSMFNVDTTNSYLFSSFQYIAVGAALSQSFGLFRQPLYHHFILCAVILGQFICMTVFLLYPTEGIQAAFSLMPLDESYRISLFVLALVNSAAFVLVERLFVPHKSPDEEPFDVDQVLKDLPPKPAAAKPDPRPDFQLTLLPKLRWRKPAFVVVEEVASPVWAAMT